MVDIIIPAYNAHKTIKRTLDSIMKQNIIGKIKIYVINDASKTDYSKEVKYFSQFMDIVEIKLRKNSGPGKARQIGIERSNSEYIVFIDADDILENINAIKILVENIEKSKSDVVVSSFYEELENGDMYKRDNNTIWLHGKIYRRSFLKKNNIFFNNSYSNEDNGFNSLVLLHNPVITTIYDVTYVWLYNKNSITRKNDSEFQFTGLSGYLYNMTWSLEIAIKNKCDRNLIASYAFMYLVTIYYYYIQYYNWEGVENLIRESKKLLEITRKYPLTTEAEKINIQREQYLYQQEEMMTVNLLDPPITLKQFMVLIDEENKN